MCDAGKRVAAALVVILAAGLAIADDRSNPFDYCLVCHGSNAAGNPVIGGPNLTTLEDWYLRRQLAGFTSGYRGWHDGDHLGRSMTTAARMLDDEQDRSDAAGFIAGYPERFPPASIAGDPQRGRVLYASCAACHGEDGKGSEALGAPGLWGQSDWYLLKQLRDYRAGRRGTHPDDSFGAMMRAAALQLTDDAALSDVTAYVQGAFRPTADRHDENQAAGSRSTSTASRHTQSTEELSMKSSTLEKGLATGLAAGTAKAMAGAVALALAAPGVLAHDVTRYPLPNGSTFPIAQAVTVPAGTELTFHSGLLPAPADADAEPGTRAYLGDTYTQTMSVLQQFEASLKAKGMGLGNIIKMNVFLVGDPELGGKMDFAGFMRAYSQFFGTAEQPHLPARAAVQIAGLARGAFVEIEVIAAR